MHLEDPETVTGAVASLVSDSMRAGTTTSGAISGAYGWRNHTG